jgi:amino acid permease
VWATVFCFGVIFPLSLPRQLSEARYSNLCSFVLSFYFAVALVMICCADKQIVPNVGQNLTDALFPQLPVFHGVVTSIPVIIYCMMYSQNAPQIYAELKHKSLDNMKTVIVKASVVVATTYIFAGFFGYATWVSYLQLYKLASH